MLDRLGSRKNAELVLGDLSWDARHIGRLPGKRVLVGAEEVDEHEFLFGRQLGADSHHLGGVGIVDYDRLGLLGRDESQRLARLARVRTALGSGSAKLAELHRIHGVVARLKCSRLLA